MRRSTERSPEISDLDALVLAEIASLGQGRLADSAETGTNTSRNQRDTGIRRSSATPRPPSGIRDDRDPRRPTGHPSGEEAEGLFDGFFDPGDPHDDLTADGPTAADLLSPEEQAFVARAVGFLSERANADLILDRIWSQALESRPDGFYDPDSTEAWPRSQAEPRAGADGSDQGAEPPGQTDAGDRPGAEAGGPRSSLASESAMAPSDIRPRPVAAVTIAGARGQPGRRPSPGPAPSPAPIPSADNPPE